MRRSCVFAMALMLVPLPGAGALASPEAGTITLIHGLPDFIADVYVDGDLLLDGFEPTEATEALRLPTGTYDVEIREVGSSKDSPPTLEDTLRVESGSAVSVVAHLDEDGAPVLSVFENDPGTLPAGRSSLIVRDVAQAPALSVLVDGEQEIGGLGSGAEDDVLLSPDRYSIEVRAGGDPVAPATDLSLVEGQARIVYVIGSQEEGTLDLMVESLGGLQTSPERVDTGTGGLVDPAPTAWRVVAMLAALLAIASGGMLRRRPTHPAS